MKIPNKELNKWYFDLTLALYCLANCGKLTIDWNQEWIATCELHESPESGRILSQHGATLPEALHNLWTDVSNS
jgi:hypothetical protein